MMIPVRAITKNDRFIKPRLPLPDATDFFKEDTQLGIIKKHQQNHKKNNQKPIKQHKKQ